MWVLCSSPIETLSHLSNAAAQAVCKQTHRECKTPTAIYTYLKGEGEKAAKEGGMEGENFSFTETRMFFHTLT